MNTKWLVLIVAGFSAVVVLSVFVVGAKNSSENTRTEVQNDSLVEETTNGGKYVEYSKSVLDDSADKRRVLFFYANWCPTCRPADADFRANIGKIPADVDVIRVNYNDSDTNDEERQLADKYGVTYQHTYVQIDKDGSEVVKWNGGQTQELLNNIKSPSI